MKDEHLVFVDAVLRNQHLLIPIHDKIAAEIVDTLVLVLFTNSLHLAEDAQFRANHNGDFADINAINGLVKLLGHTALIGNFR